MRRNKMNRAAEASADAACIVVEREADGAQDKPTTRRLQVARLEREFHLRPTVAALIAALAFGDAA